MSNKVYSMSWCKPCERITCKVKVRTRIIFLNCDPEEYKKQEAENKISSKA